MIGSPRLSAVVIRDAGPASGQASPCSGPALKFRRVAGPNGPGDAERGSPAEVSLQSRPVAVAVIGEEARVTEGGAR
jgi:hypothetical protein